MDRFVNFRFVLALQSIFTKRDDYKTKMQLKRDQSETDFYIQIDRKQNELAARQNILEIQLLSVLNAI